MNTTTTTSTKKYLCKQTKLRAIKNQPVEISVYSYKLNKKKKTIFFPLNPYV